MTLFIPSPPISYFQLGPLTIHIYALCLIAGIIAAWAIGNRRWQARGGSGESFETILLWAIPVGILGARFYHVLTHLGDYFGPGINPWSVFAIWEGGIAIYGAVGFGTLAAWLVARRRRVAFAAFADSLAPGIAVGQAIGRFGNWFNQELYGQPTDLPWGLEIDPAHRAPGFEQYATFHPTFLYESLWNVLVAGILLWCDRRFRLGRGKVFALYIALYGLGRTFTESIRLDYSYDVFGPLRFNAAVAILICLTGVALFSWLLKFRPGRETVVEYGTGGGRRMADPVDADTEESAGAEVDPAEPAPETEAAPEPTTSVADDLPEPSESLVEAAEDPVEGEPSPTLDPPPRESDLPASTQLDTPEAAGSENADPAKPDSEQAAAADGEAALADTTATPGDSPDLSEAAEAAQDEATAESRDPLA